MNERSRCERRYGGGAMRQQRSQTVTRRHAPPRPPLRRNVGRYITAKEYLSSSPALRTPACPPLPGHNGRQPVLRSGQVGPSRPVHGCGPQEARARWSSPRFTASMLQLQVNRNALLSRAVLTCHDGRVNTFVETVGLAHPWVLLMADCSSSIM